ncbi:MAG: DUF5666 domain-containing protein [Solirubrobacterales bacterium]
MATLPAAASAAGDRDSDGLSNQRERRIGTSPNRADTDRDRLKDGREVRRVRTNPLKADTDGDVIKDGRELLLGLDPLDPDSDDDGCSDRLERKGVIVAMTDSSVTIEGRRGIETTLAVDADTYFEGVDRDGDGSLSLADFQVGDRVEVNLDPAGDRADSLELDNDDDGLEEDEVKGLVSAIDGDQFTVTGRSGASKTFTVDSDTSVRAPDRDGSGTITPADVKVGDKVEAHLNPDGTRALSLKVEVQGHHGEDGDDDHSGPGPRPGLGPVRSEVKGPMSSVSSSPIRVSGRDGKELILTSNSFTRYEVPDRDGSGTRTLADFQVGDRVEAKFVRSTGALLKLEYDGVDDDSDDGSND